MVKEQKIKAQEAFNKLEKHLCYNLGWQQRKLKIIENIERKTLNGEHKEKVFKKIFLSKVLWNCFRDSSIEIIIEGMSNEENTQFCKRFFGSKPAPDFLFKSKIEPSLFPPKRILPLLETVGEVKYGDLTFRSFVTGLGQVIGYLKASQLEKSPKIYGYYIFFNTNTDKVITETDKKFLEEIWEKENVFVVII